LGCSSTKPLPAGEIAKPQMLGLSKDEVVTCMGQPELKWADGSVETWQFVYGTCSVNLTLGADNKVKAVNYNAKTVRDKGDKSTDDLPSEDEQCARVPEVASCIRWLRR
jgi:outer membrane protein assembly factor BamE (lipoprotein component of BamABCDE complex)